MHPFTHILVGFTNRAEKNGYIGLVLVVVGMLGFVILYPDTQGFFKVLTLIVCAFFLVIFGFVLMYFWINSEHGQAYIDQQDQRQSSAEYNEQDMDPE